MLKDRLFAITGKEIAENGACTYRIQLDETHPIYAAHFAGNPVTPGACIIQIAKELAADAIGHPVDLLGVRNTKFLNIMQPHIHREISVETLLKTQPDSPLSFSATFFSAETTFAKSTVLLA